MDIHKYQQICHRKILVRLGYNKKEVEEISYLIENHDNIINIDNVNKDNIELTKNYYIFNTVMHMHMIQSI